MWGGGELNHSFQTLYQDHQLTSHEKEWITVFFSRRWYFFYSKSISSPEAIGLGTVLLSLRNKHNYTFPKLNEIGASVNKQEVSFVISKKGQTFSHFGKWCNVCAAQCAGDNSLIHFCGCLCTKPPALCYTLNYILSFDVEPLAKVSSYSH